MIKWQQILIGLGLQWLKPLRSGLSDSWNHTLKSMWCCLIIHININVRIHLNTRKLHDDFRKWHILNQGTDTGERPDMVAMSSERINSGSHTIYKRKYNKILQPGKAD